MKTNLKSKDRLEEIDYSLNEALNLLSVLSNAFDSESCFPESNRAYDSVLTAAMRLLQDAKEILKSEIAGEE